MPPDLDTLWTLVDQLDAEAECVTFYDALTLVRAALPSEDIPRGLIVDWVALHDAPHVTDGARHVLGQFLQRLNQRQEQHRRLALQLIVLKDSGKTLRAAIGQPIAVALDARPQQGWAWQVSTCPDAVAVEEMPLGAIAGEASLSARFVLTPARATSGLCRIEEMQSDASRPAGVMPSRTSRRAKHVAPNVRRTFELFIIVEGH